MLDMAERLTSRVQLTTGRHQAYLEAVEGAFGADMNYAQPLRSLLPITASRTSLRLHQRARRTNYSVLIPHQAALATALTIWPTW